MGMEIDVRLDWTPNQWRRFLGRADMTPLVELAAVMLDKMALHLMDQRLASLNADPDKHSIIAASSAALVSTKADS